MARPHIEFVQCQNVQWTDCPDGSSIKLLNADCESGEETLLVRFPAGWISRNLATNDRAEEFFVFSGSIATDDVMHRRHSYGFLPRGSGLGLGRSDEGAVVLLFRHGRDGPDSSALMAEPIAIDTPSMPWDTST